MNLAVICGFFNIVMGSYGSNIIQHILDSPPAKNIYIHHPKAI